MVGRPFWALNRAYFPGAEFPPEVKLLLAEDEPYLRSDEGRPCLFSPPYDRSQEVQFDPIKGYSGGASPAQSRLTGHCSSWQIYMRFLVSHTSQLMSFSSVYQPSPSGVQFHWLFISPLLKGRVDISGCLDFFVVVLLVLFFCRSQLWRAGVISQSKVRQLYRSNN